MNGDEMIPEGIENPDAQKKVEDNIEKTSSSTWLSRIKASEEYMKKYLLPKWELARKRMRSSMMAKKQAGGYPTHEQVAMLVSICTNYINSVYFKNPQCNLKARDDRESEKVENTEVKINDLFKDKKIKKTIRRVILDAFNAGFGSRYVDFDYQDFQTENPATDEMGQPMMQQGAVDPMTGMPVQNPIMARMKTANDPVIYRLRPDLVRFPRGFDFDNAHDSPWLGFDIFLTLEDVKKNRNFSENVTANIKGSSFEDVSKPNERSYLTTAGRTDDIKWVRLHYVFEKTGTKNQFNMLVLCDEVKDSVLQETTWAKGTDGYPIKFLYHNPLDDDETYPCSDAWNMESQLAAVDSWWRTLVNHVKRSLPQVLYDKDRLKGIELQNLKKTEDLQYVGLSAGGQPLNMLVQMFEKAKMHPDTNLLYTSARQLLSEIGPKSGLGMGNEGATTGTATGDKIIQSNETIDLDGRIDDIREFIIDIVVDFAGLLEKNVQGVVQIQGQLASSGKEIARETDRSGFTGRINADIDIETMQAPNREIFRRQLMDAFATMKMFERDLAKKKKALDGEWIAKKIAENFGIRNFEKAIVDLNIRDPGQETIDFVFHSVPMAVQDGEVLEDHLRNHMTTMQDEIQMQLFEKMKPGYVQTLQQHIAETQMKMQEQKQMDQQMRPRSPVNGQRNPMATEFSRTTQV
jgi:hypothetical protein